VPSRVAASRVPTHVLPDAGGPEFPLAELDSEALCREMELLGIPTLFISTDFRRRTRRRMCEQDGGAFRSAVRTLVDEVRLQFRSLRLVWPLIGSEWVLVEVTPKVPSVLRLLAPRAVYLPSGVKSDARSRLQGSSSGSRLLGRRILGRRAQVHDAILGGALSGVAESMLLPEKSAAGELLEMHRRIA